MEAKLLGGETDVPGWLYLSILEYTSSFSTYAIVLWYFSDASSDYVNMFISSSDLYSFQKCIPLCAFSCLETEYFLGFFLFFFLPLSYP